MDTPLTQYFVASTLDGFIADEHDDLSWLFQFSGPGSTYDDFIAEVGAIAMGATTYGWILDNVEGPWPYPDQPSWIFTHRDLPVAEGADVRFTQEPVPEVHAAMRAAAGDRNIWLVGGGDLVGQFLDHGLLDQIQVTVMPVLLGRGAPLLPRRRTTPMRLTATVPSTDQTSVHLVYAVD